MSDEESAIPQESAIPEEQRERIPPPRPPHTAVGNPFARDPHAAPFHSVATGEGRLPWRSIRDALASITGFLLLGLALWVFSVAPELRKLGAVMVFSSIAVAVVLALVAWVGRSPRLPSFHGENRRRGR